MILLEYLKENNTRISESVSATTIKYEHPNLNENIILSRILADDVTVLFYVRSFDVRGMPLDQAHHYSAPDVFGNRASFRTVTDPACLLVDEVHRNDEGVYRCRVDFRNSATKSFRYNLSVIGK